MLQAQNVDLCVFTVLREIYRITFMTFYTEEVQSDSKAFDLYKGEYGSKFIWGTGVLVYSFFNFSPSRHIWDIKSGTKKWAWMGKDLE